MGRGLSLAIYEVEITLQGKIKDQSYKMNPFHWDPIFVHWWNWQYVKSEETFSLSNTK